jgi:predicted ATP-binding protein involved in virulence
VRIKYHFDTKVIFMQNTKSEAYLHHVYINDLWGRVDIDWTLHNDVNILLGENGTGKSTILRLIATSTIKNFSLHKKPHFGLIELEDSEGVITKSTALSPIMLETGERGYGVSFSKQLKTLNCNYLNTVEFYFNTGNRSEEATEGSNLDHKLDFVTRKYLAYQANQANKVFANKISFEKAFERKSYLIKTLNELFKSSDKTVDERESELEFLVENSTKISRNNLSSGEKQLLIILLTVICQDDLPSVLLLDEPEISLHLHWQYRLIEIIRTLNPNCQIILATHSPSIFNDGWRNKVFWMEDIKRKTEVLA